MENSSNYLREHQIVKFNREASNATKNTKLARVKPARDRDRVGCFIPHLSPRGGWGDTLGIRQSNQSLPPRI